MARRLALTVNGRPAELQVVSEDGVLRVELNGTWHTAELARSNRSGLYSLLIDGRSWELFARERPGGMDLLIGNRVYAVEPAGARRADRTIEEAPAGTWSLTSPLTGQVAEVRVAGGDEVQAGQTLVIVESMKMNNELIAARGGIVSDVSVAPGDRVERGKLLLRIG
jgi:glutaconyl-CoA/methylmalonyl-CoA decarboxylase subunit gamma